MSDKIKVFQVVNPGWDSSMILESVREVLNNIEIELDEGLKGAEIIGVSPLGDVIAEFTISIVEMTREELDALGDFEG